MPSACRESNGRPGTVGRRSRTAWLLSYRTGLGRLRTRHLDALDYDWEAHLRALNEQCNLAGLANLETSIYGSGVSTMDELPGLKQGDVLTHVAFGRGIVVELDNGTRAITVLFAEHGTKRISIEQPHARFIYDVNGKKIEWRQPHVSRTAASTKPETNPNTVRRAPESEPRKPSSNHDRQDDKGRGASPISSSTTKLSERHVASLYYMTPVDHLASIMQHGILAKNKVERLQISRRSIALESVQSLRSRVRLSFRGSIRSLHDYAPLYFCARTPMLSLRRDVQDDIVYIEVAPSMLDLPGVVLSDGNAAAQGLRVNSGRVIVTVAEEPNQACARTYEPSWFQPTGRPVSDFYAGIPALDRLPWGVILANSWESGNREAIRQKHAEALIPDRIPPSFFLRLRVRKPATRERVLRIIDGVGRSMEVVLSPELYFPDNPETSGLEGRASPGDRISGSGHGHPHWDELPPPDDDEYWDLTSD